MNGVQVINHPLIQNKVSMLRDKNTGVREFRELVEEISTILAYEATRDLPTEDRDVETPCGVAHTKVITTKIGIVSILRAGEGMLNGIHNLMPFAKVGHIGLYRDPETLNPVQYYCKLPDDIENRVILLVDPMNATGGTACAGIRLLKNAGARDIRLLHILSCQQGCNRVWSEHPEIPIWSADYDHELNDHGYIVPGLGDAGDRMFGTK